MKDEKKIAAWIISERDKVDTGCCGTYDLFYNECFYDALSEIESAIISGTVQEFLDYLEDWRGSLGWQTETKIDEIKDDIIFDAICYVEQYLSGRYKLPIEPSKKAHPTTGFIPKMYEYDYFFGVDPDCLINYYEHFPL